ncbi:MAG: tRNA pseudouridine(13) synthase TruD [Methanospirillaceae archaeon]|nr:tRNA pseudouridine(13) synthase TruD [Methanospirillaceae archaeon]
MKQSPYQLEHDIGISWYVSDTNGTGGIIRKNPEDFLVEEIAVRDLKGGIYSVCRLTKTNWDQQRVIREISHRLGISNKRIGFAGTKDKRAKTTQYISLYNVPEEQIAGISIKDVSIQYLGTSDKQISLGDLLGNSFSITVSECESQVDEDELRRISSTFHEGVPNYYGLQRFGVNRPNTHLIGFALLRREYEEAVRIFIGMPGRNEDEPAKRARETYLATNDPRAALREMPQYLSPERTILHHLIENPLDYKGSFLRFPKTFRSMFVSAAQSYFFNMTLSNRIARGSSLIHPEMGDTLLFSDRKTDIVTEKNHKMAEIAIKRKRCSIGIAIPGRIPVKITSQSDEYMKMLMEKEGINPEQYDMISHYLETSFDGTIRSASIFTDISVQHVPDGYQLQFTLGPGQYATTICREFMKSPPDCMV